MARRGVPWNPQAHASASHEVLWPGLERPSRQTRPQASRMPRVREVVEDEQQGLRHQVHSAILGQCDPPQVGAASTKAHPVNLSLTQGPPHHPICTKSHPLWGKSMYEMVGRALTANCL